MIVIVALGNPGSKYAFTRHNISWLFLDYLVKQVGGSSESFEKSVKFEAEVLKIKLADKECLLVKPQTFMNDSGRSAQKICQFYKLDPIKDLVLIHDDLDIPFGQWKWSEGKGPKVHNGVSSVEQNLYTKEFKRLRIGICGETYPLVKKSGLPIGIEYVLKDFSMQEKLEFDLVFEAIKKSLYGEHLL